MEAIAKMNGSALAPEVISAELFLRWVSYLDAKPKTVATYRRAIRQFGRYLNAEGVKQPTRETVLDFRAALEDEGKKAATVNAYLIAVKLFFRWTAQAGIYPNVAEHVKGLKVSNEYKKDCLTSSQARTVLDTCDRSTLAGKRDFALLALMMSTGIRTIEAARANVEDLQTRECESAGGTSEDVHLLYLQGKGRDDRQEFVKIAAPVYEAITEYLSAEAQGKAIKANAPLFASASNHNGGGRMSTRSISRIAKAHFLKAGINSSRITAHSLRHTAGTLMLRQGVPLTEVQQILRHKNVNTTMIYVHMMERAATTGEAAAARAIFGR